MIPFACHKISIVVVGLLFFSSSKGDIVRRASTRDHCVSPGGVIGICRNINDCKPLVGLLIRGKSRPRPWVIDFLLKSHCGFQGKDPIVCCPIDFKLKDVPENDNSAQEEESRDDVIISSCGSIQTQDKIVGGTVTGRHEFPWMALIGYKTESGVKYKCGGSLITPRYVLTAAHCVTLLKENMTPILVRLGEHDMSESSNCEDDPRDECENPINVEIDKIIPHPNYSKTDIKNDIALIRLRKKVPVSQEIQPICLPLKEFQEKSLKNKVGVVAGWGTAESGMTSQVLRKVVIPILPLSECSKIYKKRRGISESQLCAGGEEGKDSCQGDSGGPLQTLALGPQGYVYVLKGIVSFGPRHCATEGMPAVYTNVSFFLDWVLKNIYK